MRWQMGRRSSNIEDRLVQEVAGLLLLVGELEFLCLL